MPLCTFDQTHHPHRPPPPRSTLKTTANQQQTPGEQPIILLLRFLFPRLSSVRSPPCATPTNALHLLARHHFHSSQQDAQLQGRLRLWLLAADGMPWNPSLSHLALLGPDAVLRCPRAPAESAEIPEAPPSVDGVTEPLGPLSRHPAANTQLRFRRCTSPRRYCIAFPLLGRHPCSISFQRRDVDVFVCKPRRVRSKMSNSKPSCFNSSEPCTADGMVSKSSAVSKAWRGVPQELLTASRQPASSIMLSSLNRQWVQGSSKRLVKESGGGCPPLNPDPDAVDVWVCSSRPRVTRRIPGRLCMPSHPPGRLCRCAEAPVI